MTEQSSPAYYPAFLALEGRPCLVVGGGKVAEGKVQGLLAAGASLTIVSPELRPGLKQLAELGRVRHVARGYSVEDLGGMSLVMVATDDGSVNARVAADCRLRGIWVNAADDPPNCDFILPSVIRKGRVTLAASTSGASPALARRLREDLEVFLSDDIGALADLLAEVRSELQSLRLSVNSERWQEAIDAKLRALLSQGRYAEARSYLLVRLGVSDALPARIAQTGRAGGGDEC